MGYFPHVKTADTESNFITVIHNLTTLCLNGTLQCDDFMDVIMGDRPGHVARFLQSVHFTRRLFISNEVRFFRL